MGNKTQTDVFMEHFPNEGLTFDDVSLITQYADFLPHEADLSTSLAKSVGLNIPFLSAAMDTVTEKKMAISMASLGGIGVVHKNLDIDRQRKIIGSVKHHLHGLINFPITFRVGQTVGEIQHIRREKDYQFTSFPIVNDAGHCMGILTGRDLKFCTDLSQPVEKVMTTDMLTAPPGTTVEQAYELMTSHKIGKLPIVEDGRLVGLYSYKDVKSLIEDEHPLYNLDDKYRLRAAAAVGPGDHERAEALAGEQVDVLVVDTAHGHSKGVIEMTTWIKKHYPEISVIAGNIATGEAATALRDAGADAVKVGIGPGSICTTRVVAGVGIPQISAIHTCRKALEGSIPIISDGGIRNSGDAVKAIVAGASAVMMGSIFAGTEESPGEKIVYQGRQYVVYRGMGSLEAMKTREGSRQRYGQKDGEEDDLVPQGIEGMVPYSGTVEKVLKQYIGGVQAGMGYCGCRTIPELQEKGRFIRVTAAGMKEAHAHDVIVTKDAPNYRA